MSKRSLFVILALISMVALILSSCAGGSSVTTTTSPTTQTTTTTSTTTPAATSTTQVSKPTPTSSTPQPTTSTPAAGQPQYGGVLKIHKRETPDTAIGDVQIMGPRTNESTANVLYQPLSYYTPDGKFVPILATAFTPAADQTYMDITLREGVKFHDGADFNAEAVKWNMDRYMVKRPSKDPQWKSIEVLSPYKVRVNLNYWTNTIYSGLAAQLMGSPKGFKEQGDEWGGAHPAGTGPFKFVKYERDVKMILAKFENYWEKGKPYLDGIENIYLTDPMTTQMAFESGAFDLAYLFLGKQAAEVREEDFPYNELNSALCPVHALVPSSAEPGSPLSNLKVRQAVYYSIDRQAISDALGYGWLSPINQLASKGSIAHIPDLEKEKSYDIAKAKALLTEAGYPNGFKTKLIMPPQWANAELASALQSSLAAANIKAEIEFPEAGKFTEYRWTAGGWNEGLVFQEYINWAVYTMHPSFYWWRAGATPQFFDMAHPAGFDELVGKLLKTTEIDKSMIEQFSRMLFDDKTVIPIYQLQMVAFFQPKVHTNFMAFSFKTDWLPADTWIEK